MAEDSGTQGDSGTSSQGLDKNIARELRRRYVFECRTRSQVHAVIHIVHSYHYYDWFRDGRADRWHLFLGFEDFDKDYVNLPVPRKSAVPSIEIPDTVTRKPYHTLPPFEEDENDVARQREALQALRDGTHPTTQALVPLGMRFLKVLGTGSQGTAALFETTEENNQIRKIVAKFSTPRGERQASSDESQPSTEHQDTDLREEKGRLKVSQGRKVDAAPKHMGENHVSSARTRLFYEAHHILPSRSHIEAKSNRVL